MRTVSISGLRADSFAILQRVQKTKRPIRITRFGKPLAEIHPCNLASLNSDLVRAQQDARDIEIINRNADRLNAEAEDGLEYQAPWDPDDYDENSRPAKKKSWER